MNSTFRKKDSEAEVNNCVTKSPGTPYPGSRNKLQTHRSQNDFLKKTPI